MAALMLVMTMSKTRAIPRAYALNPYAFGRAPVTQWVIPALGSTRDLELAKVQHWACLALSRAHDPGRARRVSGRFGFSVQRWSEYTTGQAWPTERGWAAVTVEVLWLRS